jgi:hypothetical protein
MLILAALTVATLGCRTVAFIASRSRLRPRQSDFAKSLHVLDSRLAPFPLQLQSLIYFLFASLLALKGHFSHGTMVSHEMPSV